MAANELAVHTIFQSTLPHGSDGTPAYRAAAEKNFNPRSLTGATHSWSWIHVLNLFQSTLPRGSDIKLAEIVKRKINFNPRSLAGATAESIMSIL